jgi:hypothetical protein
LAFWTCGQWVPEAPVRSGNPVGTLEKKRLINKDAWLAHGRSTKYVWICVGRVSASCGAAED